MKEKVIVSIEDENVAYLKMNDKVGNNIFSDDFIAKLISGIEKIEKHQPKVMILQGLPHVFSGGADKKNLIDLCEGKVHVKDLMISEKLLYTPFPVIAAMEGHAVGGGFVMAMCCDVVLAAKESRYGAVFMSLGFTPGMGCTTLLSELVGPYIANEMMYTGKSYKGSELEKKSTNINYILSQNEIMPKARDIASRISEKDRQSLYILKNSLTRRKKKLLVDARVQEDLMHRITFSFPETRKTIEEYYNENK